MVTQYQIVVIEDINYHPYKPNAIKGLLVGALSYVFEYSPPLARVLGRLFQACWPGFSEA